MRNFTERRSQRRRSVFLRASIHGIVDEQAMECAIQDASRTGCKIISDNVDLIPDIVSLTICGLGETFAGRVVWRKGNEAGVQFIGEEGGMAPPMDPAGVFDDA